MGRNNKGAIVVFATGNDSNSQILFPANCLEGIIAVGSIGSNGTRSSFSNYGTELDVVAPGENIATTDLLWGYGYSAGSDYTLTFDGTSAACPHVAAIAALVLSVNPDLRGEEVVDIIESTAKKISGYSYATYTNRTNGTWNNQVGYGLVDAYSAVQEAINRR